MDSAAVLVSVLVLALALSIVLTSAVRRYALRTNILDLPNERSAHVVPVPRGGGVAIVASFLGCAAGLVLLRMAPLPLTAALLVAGALIAILGFADDRTPLPARYRFAGHLIAGSILVAVLGNLPSLPALGHHLSLGAAAPFLAVLLVCWSINLFNFMDGIDGIAGVEAVTVCGGAAMLWALSGSSGHWVLPVLLSACCLGFLFWNFPPARIFMGDAGSGFLGLMIAAFALWAGSERPVLFWSWMILYGCFMVDATTTLIRRVRRGEKFHVAHRSHAYQYAARRCGSHRTVTLAVGAINVLWLLPIAAFVAFGHLDGVLGMLVAYVPLVLLAYHFKAGDRRAQEAT